MPRFSGAFIVPSKLLEREVDCLPGDDIPGDEDSVQERANIDVAGLAEEIGGDQRDDGQDRHLIP